MAFNPVAKYGLRIHKNAKHACAIKKQSANIAEKELEEALTEYEEDCKIQSDSKQKGINYECNN